MRMPKQCVVIGNISEEEIEEMWEVENKRMFTEIAVTNSAPSVENLQEL